ncbi:MAG: hypothetical protein CVU11_12885 [Bacteroidetes bacterium HGW-Bacteroidetes-6]|jgi:DUF4097 and DUF4098 domain-containing protein YvlB|nr:MAG: hypothetical protein CVU11_12885 [Bacteroidetes bacterium HGW-Bacteroidetes-6]
MLDENSLKEFILAYTKGVDLINCIHYSLENNFEKPDDYDDYGCNIAFITGENSSVKDNASLEEWNIYHHNNFVESKITAESATGYGFPPPYNFITENDITINSIEKDKAEVEVETNNGNYIFYIESPAENEYGMHIRSVFLKPQWGGNLIPVIE